MTARLRNISPAAGNLHVVPKNVSDAKAVFIEPLAAACQILTQLNIREFPTAAVSATASWPAHRPRLQAAGTRVVLYGKHANKLAYAHKARIATKKVRGDASDLRRVHENYRLVVEATGSPTGLTLAQHMTSRAARCS